MYADHICIISPSPSSLYKLLKICTEFTKDNTILFNRCKSKYMCFKPKRLSNLLIPDMYLNGELLTTFAKTKYLGVVIDCDSHGNDDMIRQFKAICARGNIWISRFKISYDDVKSCLFQCYLSSVYGCQLWNDYKPTALKKSMVAQCLQEVLYCQTRY